MVFLHLVFNISLYVSVGKIMTLLFNTCPYFPIFTCSLTLKSFMFVSILITGTDALFPIWMLLRVKCFLTLMFRPAFSHLTIFGCHPHG